MSTIENFYSHVNQVWLTNTSIPSGECQWSEFQEVNLKIMNRVHDLILDRTSEDSHDAALVKQFYDLFMNTDKLESEGNKPLEPLLATIDNINSHGELMRILAQHQMIDVNSFISTYVDADKKRSKINCLYLSFGNLLVPDKEYYTEDNFKPVVAALTTNLKSQSDAFGLEWNADQMITFDQQMALLHPSQEERRNDEDYYNYVTSNTFCKEVGKIWSAFFDELRSLGFYVDDFICTSLSYYKKLTKLLMRTELQTLKDYCKRKVLMAFAEYGNAESYTIYFEYMGKVVNGQQEPKVRWKRALEAAEELLGFAVGKMYTDKYFSSEAKEKVLTMVEGIKEEMRLSLVNNDWLSAPTKQKALEKLATFICKIGYPDVWRNYSEFTSKPDSSLIELVIELLRFNNRRQIAKINQRVDRTEWFMVPHTVNAYYDEAKNEIVFPAGILQPPFFDENANPASYYGAIGAVIAHEITHGYDDQGAKYDAYGNMVNWWTSADKENFEQRTLALKNQFDSYTFRGQPVNGGLILGENLADLGGLTLSLRALQKITDNPDDARIFFESAPRVPATVWKNVISIELAHKYLKIDPHSPAELRVNIVNNLDEFYELYSVGKQMFIAPELRVKVW